MNFGIYIHWPFCASKCPYCDFFSVVKKVDEDVLIKDYLKDLVYYNSLTKDRKVTSVFFGGGTPSLIKPQNVARIIDKISELWNLSKDVEISLEANPCTNKKNLFKNLHLAGINRLSLGVQALNDEDLLFLGRTHDKECALAAIDDVLANFDNNSMDLIYARPKQNMDKWEQELNEATSFGFKHISLYQLTIEKGTIFYKKGIKALDEDLALELYKMTVEYMRNHNYFNYEISNFAQNNFECRHNLIYWQGDEYIGIGKGAHGRLMINKTWRAYQHQHNFELLTPQERATELIFMGLRLNKGINKQKFECLCGIDINDFINQKNKKSFIEQKLIMEDDCSIFPTDKGMAVLDYIIQELCC